jgi:hypothetical protein
MRGLRLDALAESASAGYSAVLGDDELRARWIDGRAREDVMDFLRGRVEAYLKDGGIPYDVAAAVISVAWQEPGVALARARAIASLRGESAFERLVTGVKRVGNILPKERRRLATPWESLARVFAAENADAPFSRDRFEAPAEHALCDAVRRSVRDIPKLEEKSFEGVLGPFPISPARLTPTSTRFWSMPTTPRSGRTVSRFLPRFLRFSGATRISRPSSSRAVLPANFLPRVRFPTRRVFSPIAFRPDHTPEWPSLGRTYTLTAKRGLW